jgi:hypothetical protein
MNLPKQSAPVVRDEMVANTDMSAITASDCCPGNKQCLGLCVFGQCIGYCN